MENRTGADSAVTALCRGGSVGGPQGLHLCPGKHHSSQGAPPPSQAPAPPGGQMKKCLVVSAAALFSQFLCETAAGGPHVILWFYLQSIQTLLQTGNRDQQRSSLPEALHDEAPHSGHKHTSLMALQHIWILGRFLSVSSVPDLFAGLQKELKDVVHDQNIGALQQKLLCADISVDHLQRLNSLK